MAIITLVKEDYKTLGNFDTLQHRRNCTYDYKLVEDGEIWDIDREIKYIASKAASKQVRTNEFNFKSVTVYSTTGYAIYELRSTITQPDGSSKNYSWFETVIVRRIANKWKIALMHSTAIKDKP
ncbi:hypothetical protein [Flavihumibacter fluvii]|uniref:hypothetical protein n=1 Tax=Flavihumibacter fluvii TaxID=2838157 RepID=UPI001BDDCE89|nr:hypothetical protein [Flavihumibacter fluvii]ULQ52244.1 hypothetical protein KJS93_19325 [Flavihumibacter fluvii]